MTNKLYKKLILNNKKKILRTLYIYFLINFQCSSRFQFCFRLKLSKRISSDLLIFYLNYVHLFLLLVFCFFLSHCIVTELRSKVFSQFSNRYHYLSMVIYYFILSIVISYLLVISNQIVKLYV